MTVITVCSECSAPVTSMNVRTVTAAIQVDDRTEQIAEATFPCGHTVTTTVTRSLADVPRLIAGADIHKGGFVGLDALGRIAPVPDEPSTDAD